MAAQARLAAYKRLSVVMGETAATSSNRSRHDGWAFAELSSR